MFLPRYVASLTLAIEMPVYFTDILKYVLLPSALYLASHDSLYMLRYFFEFLAIDVLLLNIEINSIQLCHLSSCQICF